jgi:enoyl-CoA hydratase
MTDEAVLVERRARVGLITMNRPRQLNALSDELMDAVAGAAERFDREEEVAALVVTGGPDVFAAGADLKQMAELSAVDMLRANRIRHWDRLRRVAKPLLAAVSGYALGGGCEMAMLCDLIVASDSARFGQPEINVGLMPGAGGTARLTYAVGKTLAMDLVLTGRMIDAWEAQRRGLVARVVPREVVVDEAVSLAAELASKPPISVRLAKESVTRTAETSVSEGVEHERKLFYLLFASEDAREGMRAFVEKRKPSYQGR